MLMTAFYIFKVAILVPIAASLLQETVEDYRKNQ